jgi:tetratricopeptide (TPR) repeat protein
MTRFKFQPFVPSLSRFYAAFFLLIAVLFPLPSFGDRLMEPPELVGLNNKVKKLTTEQTTLYTDLMDALENIEHQKDADQQKSAIGKLDKILQENPEYSDGHFIKAMVYCFYLGSHDYPMIIENIDKAIRLHESIKYESAYKTTASHFSLRARVLKEGGDLPKAMDDLERAINLDLREAIKPSGTTPDEEAKPGTWGNSDFAEIINKYPNDYRAYLFRGLFYHNFGLLLNNVPDGYEISISDIHKAIELNPKSAICNYLLGLTLNQQIMWGRKSNENYRKEAKFILNEQSIWNAYPEVCA